MARGAEYVLTEDTQVRTHTNNIKILPAGAFVQPIDWYYLPKHFKESVQGIFMDHKKDIVCYTHFGLQVLSRSVIRRVSHD